MFLLSFGVSLVMHATYMHTSVLKPFDVYHPIDLDVLRACLYFFFFFFYLTCICIISYFIVILKFFYILHKLIASHISIISSGRSETL